MAKLIDYITKNKYNTQSKIKKVADQEKIAMRANGRPKIYIFKSLSNFFIFWQGK